MLTDLQTRTTELTDPVPGVVWSISIRSSKAKEVAGVCAGDVLSTASIGKLLLLVEIARQYDAGTLGGTELLKRTDDIAVTDSGIWQHLEVDALSVDDLATLVGSVSDNLATNVLLERVGLKQVQAAAPLVGFTKTTLLDRVRQYRGVGDPSHLSQGSASELSQFMSLLSVGALVSPSVSGHVDRWLSAGADLSMVAAPFGFDPLAHVGLDRGLLLRNKTGTDVDVRADVGYVHGPYASLSYAVIANWNDGDADRRDDVLRVMWTIGGWLREFVSSPESGTAEELRQR